MIAIGCLVATSAWANWEETSLKGLLKEVTVSHEETRSCPECTPAVSDRISVALKNISDAPISFRYRFRCLKGPTQAKNDQNGDSSWFADRVEAAGFCRASHASWDGCDIVKSAPGGGVMIEVQAM
jgi:hypothetical protein